jgi:hypothetical protein
MLLGFFWKKPKLSFSDALFMESNQQPDKPLLSSRPQQYHVVHLDSWQEHFA